MYRINNSFSVAHKRIPLFYGAKLLTVYFNDNTLFKIFLNEAKSVNIHSR